MAFVRGTSQYFVFNAVDLTASLASEVKLGNAGGESDASTIGNNWQRFLQAQAGGQFSVSGVWDSGTAATGLDSTLFAALNGGGPRQYQYAPAGSASPSDGVNSYWGHGIVTAFEVGGAVGDKVPFSATIRLSDAGTAALLWDDFD